jgi:Kef-type K+ transport system membrane component KefB
LEGSQVHFIFLQPQGGSYLTAGFTEHIFPTDSRPFLSLVANLGLCLFIFLIGLELESAVIKRNARLSAMIALAGMAIPFGFGVALSVPLYNHFIDKSVGPQPLHTSTRGSDCMFIDRMD